MLKAISKMSVKEFETFTGRHLNVIERSLFKLEQKKLKKSFDAQGNVTNKKLDKYLKKADGSSGFHLGGFALGFLLGLIGVLIAYVAFSDDNKSNRVKWSWIGVGVVVVLYLVLLVSLF
jgi:Flp pilus assembly protein TadB